MRCGPRLFHPRRGRRRGRFSVQSDWPDHVFDIVGVDFDATIGQERLQPFPVPMDIGELFAKAGFGGDAQPLFLQPFAKSADQRSGACLTSREALVRRHPADFGFNGIEPCDPAQALSRDLGSIAVEHFRQLAPGMRPAMRDTDQAAALAGGARQAIVALIAVELQDPVEAVQDPLSVQPTSVRSIEEDPRRVYAIPAPIITRQYPEIPRLGPATSGIEHWRGGLIHKQFGGCLVVLGQPVNCWPQMEGCDADPIGQRAAMDVNAGTPEDLALSIKWEMVGVFADQNVRDGAFGWQAAFDQSGGGRCL